MAHIHTDPGQYDFTASSFIVRTDTPEVVVVTHPHKLLKRQMQFGGHIELTEHVWQTVAHETPEESGWDLDQLTLLQPPHRITHLSSAILHPAPVCINSHPFPDEHNHTDIGFAFVTDQPPRRRPADGEVHTINQYTYQELDALSDDEIEPNVREVFQFIIKTCLTEWDLVNPNDFAH